MGPFLRDVLYDVVLNLTFPEGSFTVGIADSFAVFATARNMKMIQIIVNKSMHRINSWLQDARLTITIHKTEAFLITNKNIFNPPTISFEGELIKNISSRG